MYYVHGKCSFRERSGGRARESRVESKRAPVAEHEEVDLKSTRVSLSY